jgi:quinolinate synthase
METIEHLQQKIRQLAHDRDAMLLAHNYQPPEIQSIADYVGDSLGLCLKAQDIDAKTILFCGVLFMAETAAILNPTKTVLIPDPDARCPMAAQLPANLIQKAKSQYPGVPVVLYVNTTAEAKAEADVVCTSSNLCQVLDALNTEPILFGPDGNLATYARNICNREVITIPEHGFCHVHVTFTFDPDIHQLMQEYPNAELLVHPECDWELQAKADFIGSTGQMLKYAKERPTSVFIIATEVDMTTRLRNAIPNKTFIPALRYARCKAMKKITLLKVKDSLLKMKYQVTVPKTIAARARQAIEKMIHLTQTPLMK